ncbi:hypothetical protein KUTeg_003367 [Tegillarca granosa]|uniref:RGS domain-containing protein n=1 Tax=Tegillarca granosa TaxID=220873 RepID=A0ABQ9FLW4_TEGGR|nr:hypothetical protein KUTeg_003367 [Tegillarca granosa]
MEEGPKRYISFSQMKSRQYRNKDMLRRQIRLYNQALNRPKMKFSKVVERYAFEPAQEHIYALMKKDSYPRYLRSEQYKNKLLMAKQQPFTKKNSGSKNVPQPSPGSVRRRSDEPQSKALSVSSNAASNPRRKSNLEVPKPYEKRKSEQANRSLSVPKANSIAPWEPEAV